MCFFLFFFFIYFPLNNSHGHLFSISGSKRRGMKAKATSSDPESPERRNQKAQAAKARDEARKKMLAERRAAMKQQQQQQESQEAEARVEIFLPDGDKQDK